jgi:hypothetical protein
MTKTAATTATNTITTNAIFIVSSRGVYQHYGGVTEDVRPKYVLCYNPTVKPPSSPRNTATYITAGVAALCIAVTVSYRLWETDMWQHLLVGKAIWTLRHIPATNLWSWPTYGAPDVNASWGFRALIWPVWKLGGIWGLYVWRWATTLGAFAILLAASRRMGSKGLTPFLVLVVCALTWRYRANIRPETLVAVLFALQIWILETRRWGGPDRSLWLIPIAWVWANVHISYPFGFAMLGIHLVNDGLRAARDGGGEAYRPSFKRLGLVTLAAAAISFANPWGWRALWQPFAYLFYGRHELILQTVTELQPLSGAWTTRIRSGLPFLLVLWPLLMVLRIRRRGLDLVEILVCVLYTVLTLSAIRFAGFYALAAAPYLSRDLDEWVRARSWPRWSANDYARAGLVAVLCISACIPEWNRPGLPLGVGYDESHYPVRACDFMIEHDIGGRGFNQFYLGGYMLWRFWPDRERLPFMDVHQSGTQEDHRRYTRVFTDPYGWGEVDKYYHFDYALLDASESEVTGDQSLEVLDVDTNFVMVFRDDAAALYVKREGRNAEIAKQFGYWYVPGGDELIRRFTVLCATDSSFREGARSELDRQIAASPLNARAKTLLANIDIMEARYAQARSLLEDALQSNPRAAVHERLGLIALMQDRPGEAVRLLEIAQERGQGTARLDRRLALAYAAAGDYSMAKIYCERALESEPDDPELLEALRQLGGRTDE